jgi:hypothetical protein
VQLRGLPGQRRYTHMVTASLYVCFAASKVLVMLVVAVLTVCNIVIILAVIKLSMIKVPQHR